MNLSTDLNTADYFVDQAIKAIQSNNHILAAKHIVKATGIMERVVTTMSMVSSRLGQLIIKLQAVRDTLEK
jgi:hypothetical protein